MKRTMKGLLAGIVIFAASTADTKAQVSVSANINIGNPPVYEYYIPRATTYYVEPRPVYVNTVRYRPARRYRVYDRPVVRRTYYSRPSYNRVRYVRYNSPGRSIIRHNYNGYYRVKGHPHGMAPGQAKKFYGRKQHAGHWR